MSAKATTVWLEEATMEKLRDYAYTERISIRAAVARALEQFLADKNDLLHRPQD